jgi:anti-sigma regulatory factor (Ser/Thr protein kinase)
MLRTGIGASDLAGRGHGGVEPTPSRAEPIEVEPADRWQELVAGSGLPFGAHSLSVRQVRRVVADLCGGLTAADRDDVVLCVSELVTNAVLHARTAGVLRLFVGADGVRIEVDDESPAPPRLSTEHRVAGGRGLHIVDQLAASWGHASRPGGKTVWAEVRTAHQIRESRLGPPLAGVDAPGGGGVELPACGARPRPG